MIETKALTGSSRLGDEIVEIFFELVIGADRLLARLEHLVEDIA